MNREAVIKAYDTMVKSPDDRKKLEITTPLLVAARDKSVAGMSCQGVWTCGDAATAACKLKRTMSAPKRVPRKNCALDSRR